ncbi:hypothetical protein J7K97_05290 [Candidatus Aerophobetes bacterium]|nr:hypothetical protein [Candidatus Aerophobetes bacterium]
MRFLKFFPLLIVLVISLFFLHGKCFAEGERFSLPEIFEYPPVKGRDPFYPLVRKEEKVSKVTEPKKVEKKPLPVVTHSEYKVVGIVWREGEGIALIKKGEKSWVVKEGMVIDGLKVARIEGGRGEVILIGKDRIIKLKMLEI